VPPTIGSESFQQSPVGLTEVEDEVADRKKYRFDIYQNPDGWIRIVIESSILSWSGLLVSSLPNMSKVENRPGFENSECQFPGFKIWGLI
jgi:hypothetical protein